jgi:hypothetical protein
MLFIEFMKGFPFWVYDVYGVGREACRNKACFDIGLEGLVY